jgi:hypothetical protein
MRRVYAIWFLRKSAPILFIEIPLLVLFVAKIRELIFWQRVWENASQAAVNIHSFSQFVFSALAHRASATTILLGLAVVFAFIIRDVFSATKQAASLILLKD